MARHWVSIGALRRIKDTATTRSAFERGAAVGQPVFGARRLGLDGAGSRSFSVAAEQERPLPRSRSALELHFRRKPVDPRYADDELDVKQVQGRMQAKLERKKLSKNNLLAGHYAALLACNSLTLFVHGDLSSNNARQALKKAGMRSMRVKSSLIKVAAARLSPECSPEDDHIRFAQSLSRGLTSLAMLEDPLQQLAVDTDRMKLLEECLPLSDGNKGTFKASTLGLVVGGYIRDHGKNSPDIWLTRQGVKNLIDLLQNEARGFVDAKDMEPHNMFHAKLVGALQGQMGAIRAPLQASALALRHSIGKAPKSMADTLLKIRALRDDESKNDQ